MRLYFVSDQHLVDVHEEKCQALLRFFSSIKNAEDCAHLFLLGDIFDLWVGSHSYFVKKWFSFNAELVRLRSLGVEIHIFEGNHDIYLSDYFHKQLGFHVYTGPVVLELAGRALRLEHGDQMDPDDRGYLFLRWFLRTKAMGFLINKMPQVFVRGIGEWASRLSRNYTSHIKVTNFEKTLDMVKAHAEVAYRETPYNLLVAGHIHQKIDQIVKLGESTQVRLVNLGFREEPWLLEL